MFLHLAYIGIFDVSEYMQDAETSRIPIYAR
jgi:hypothetical protein